MGYTHFSLPRSAGYTSAPVVRLQSVRAARHMVNNHGAAAADVARKRAQNLMACGKLDSAATWLEIARAIDDLDE